MEKRYCSRIMLGCQISRRCDTAVDIYRTVLELDVNTGRFYTPVEDDRKFEIEVVDFNLDTEPLNPLGQVFSGSITVSGPVRKFDPTQNTEAPKA
jgi:hypothetical protein